MSARQQGQGLFESYLAEIVEVLVADTRDLGNGLERPGIGHSAARTIVRPVGLNGRVVVHSCMEVVRISH